MNIYEIDYSIRRYYVDEFYSAEVAKLKANSKILDLGGNKINKRGRFNIEHYGLNVLYANLSTAKQPDVQSDAALLPFASESFDVVICSELLEHVPEPPAILQEANRVLRKGGIVLICVPFLYQIHGDPYDFGRYTDYYWLKQLDKAGFTEIRIQKQGLFWSVVVDMLRAWLYDLQVGGKLRFRKAAIYLVARARQLAVKWDAHDYNVHHPFHSSFTTGFGICAHKYNQE